MEQSRLNRRNILVGAATAAAAAVMLPLHQAAAAQGTGNTVTFTKTATPRWLLAFWKEIDDKTWGKGFDCFAEDAFLLYGQGRPVQG
jgi:spermidine/putrescine-binding protein